MEKDEVRQADDSRNQSDVQLQRLLGSMLGEGDIPGMFDRYQRAFPDFLSPEAVSEIKKLVPDLGELQREVAGARPQKLSYYDMYRLTDINNLFTNLTVAAMTPDPSIVKMIKAKEKRFLVDLNSLGLRMTRLGSGGPAALLAETTDLINDTAHAIRAVDFLYKLHQELVAARPLLNEGRPGPGSPRSQVFLSGAGKSLAVDNLLTLDDAARTRLLLSALKLFSCEIESLNKTPNLKADQRGSLSEKAESISVSIARLRQESQRHGTFPMPASSSQPSVSGFRDAALRNIPALAVLTGGDKSLSAKEIDSQIIAMLTLLALQQYQVVAHSGDAREQRPRGKGPEQSKPSLSAVLTIVEQELQNITMRDFTNAEGASKRTAVNRHDEFFRVVGPALRSDEITRAANFVWAVGRLMATLSRASEENRMEIFHADARDIMSSFDPIFSYSCALNNYMHLNADDQHWITDELLHRCEYLKKTYNFDPVTASAQLAAGVDMDARDVTWFSGFLTLLQQEPKPQAKPESTATFAAALRRYINVGSKQQSAPLASIANPAPVLGSTEPEKRRHPTPPWRREGRRQPWEQH